MNLIQHICCRAYQGVFRAALPFLPYREPEILHRCEELPDTLKQHKIKKILIVTDPGIVACGLITKITSVLAKEKIFYSVYDQTSANPTVRNVEEALALYQKEHCKALLAIGGGSAMDCAKALGARIACPKKTLGQLKGTLHVLHRIPLLIAVPTTAGTGSEVTPYAILTNHEKQTKKSIASPCLFPTYALLDAKYTKNLGLATTVNTAIDSLSHSVEGMMSKRANIMADIIAKEAVKIIASTFDDLISGELTEDDREKLLYASMLGGVVISQTKTTAVHAMGYSLTYFKNIDHGRANGLLLGEFTKYIERNDKDRVKEILSCMNLDSAEEFKNILAKILGDKEKFEKEELELYAEIAQNAGGTLNSMFVPSKDEILQIYVESLM